MPTIVRRVPQIRGPLTSGLGAANKSTWIARQPRHRSTWIAPWMLTYGKRHGHNPKKITAVARVALIANHMTATLDW